MTTPKKEPAMLDTATAPTFEAGARVANRHGRVGTVIDNLGCENPSCSIRERGEECVTVRWDDAKPGTMASFGMYEPASQLRSAS